MTDALPALLFSHNHHRLNVQNCDAPLDVLALEGRESLSRPFRWVIEFTSTDHALTAQRMLLKPASLVLHAKVAQAWGVPLQQPVRTVQGVVTAFRRLSSSRDETRYALTLRPRLALLKRSHQNAIYQDMSVPQIVEKILRERHGMRGQDFSFDLTREYPRREQVMQYGQDDLAFISRLLSEVGIWFRFSADTRLRIDVVEFFDAQKGYAPQLTLPAVAPSGMHDGAVESVWGMESLHRVVEKSVFTRDYNYRDAAADMDMQADITAGDDTTYGEAYHFADNYLTQGDALKAEPESGAFYARLRHERYLCNQTRLSGVCNAPSLAAGACLSVSGGGVDDVFAKGVVITGLRCSARRDRSLETAFTAIPARGRYGFRPQLTGRPVMAGTLPARVTSTTENDIYGHIDKDGRYRVSMLFDRAAWETGFESLWVRQARPYAGDTYGLHLPLLAGTEVAIAFEDGNPDRPYIIGALHTSTHPDHVNIANYRRNVLRTPTNNKIRLDDNREKESIKISTENGGKSQLNLGFLVDARRERRGSGFELRTDSWGALRAGKGIFISADEQSKAQGQVLEMQPAISLLKGALNQLTEWGNIAQTHHSPPPDKAQLDTLLTNTEALKSPSLLMSAPQGMAALTPEALLLKGGQALYAQSNGEINLVSGARFSAHASHGISLLSQSDGLRMVSGKGALEIESHGDAMSLTALNDITVQTVQGHLQLTAKQGITLACGGAYIRLSPQGEIEIHGPGLLSLKGRHRLESPASEAFPLPELPSSICKECLRRAQAQGQGFVVREN
ncbi:MULTISPECIES: type VI secretion system Vgr family protein [Tenebrionibacter/Tenebrionicola group]|jgi:type VI secretion system secreted protein VgrG|uniref:Type VI secretion system tip protein VgrG n=2 Tax=Tenebrionibacter/Tenebrionicola group TaxID=2969848 RepID=A0A8K0V3X7_9ENTR|nr:MULTISPECIES: type VI secretion system Vgr family protein [Tenebrionibacter/Tenebrionicola group]MBK4715191.1 type VI secretion system tip protein VgrG [Tenebrionibacter intestinalis]MBV5094216.1 type VI secretion system tip protein VgrG [Tenebrionicola larvae]